MACSFPDLEWEGPRSVVIPRAESGFGFTLRHFVVYPPQSVLDDSRSDFDGGDSQDLCREASIEPQDTIFVKSVKTESPAYLAGLQTGDRIIAVNGNSISGKSYKDVITAIHQSSPTLKLLVVKKDEDILQMAYQSLARESEGSPMASNRLQTAGLRPHQHSHSSGDLLQDSDQHGHYREKPSYPSGVVGDGRQEVRHSYPLSQWDIPPPSSDTRVSFSSPSQSRQEVASGPGWPKEEPTPWDPSMASYGRPGKAKYSFGLYFPPKSGGGATVSSGRTISVESLGKSSESSAMPKSQTFDSSPQQGSSMRKTSLDESSALTSSARSRDYFIRYSSDRAANDLRNRYGSRQPAYKSQPTYVISRSQTVSSIASPSKASASASQRHSTDLDSSRSRYIPILSEPKQSGGSDSGARIVRSGTSSSEQGESSSGSHRFVVRIPYERQQGQQQQQPALSSVPRSEEEGMPPVRQHYGTTFALTRAPNATHIEIQKSIGKPLVSQRKNQFEAGKNENTPPPNYGGHNRYKTEIEKIRTQPKFSSIAMRRASFEQSPEKEPCSSDDSHRSREQTPSEYSKILSDTAQPTVKVRKISAEHYSSGSSSPHQGMEANEQAPIRIYVSPGASHDSASPIVEIVPMFPDSVKRNSFSEPTVVSTAPSRDVGGSSKGYGVFHSPSASSCSGSTHSGGGDSAGMADSGVWVKSCQGSSDMLNGFGGEEGVSDGAVYSGDMARGEDRGGRPARKTSYLSAVNAPHARGYSQTDPPSAVESRAGYLQTPQQAIAKSQALPYPSAQSSSILPPPPAYTATQPTIPPPYCSSQPSASAPPPSYASAIAYPSPSQGAKEGYKISSITSAAGTCVPVASVIPTVVSKGDSVMVVSQHSEQAFPSDPVMLRKKLPESLEDQANKLHRRTSYLMATAGDRTNTVPIEQAFSPPQTIQEHAACESLVPARQTSSAKLHKFFGETIPENMEARAQGMEEISEVIRKGSLICKISVLEGKKCNDRSWKPVYAVLRHHELHLTKDKENPGSSSSSFEDQHIPLRASLVECARDYTKKKKHVFRLTSHQESEYLFQTEDKGTMLGWLQAIKSINEPDKAEHMDMLVSKGVPVEVHVVPPPNKMSPQLHKGRKLSALSLKAKLATSPSMRRKKSDVGAKEEHLKKSWKGLKMMKSLKRSSEDTHVTAEPESSTDNLQFGVPLEDCFPSPNNENIPLIVDLCTSIVEARGLEVVGVYRVPGNSAAINALRDEFDRGIENVNIHNEKLLDINVISSLIKSFFRKLPEPLIPPDTYEEFIQANRHPDENKRKLKLKRLLSMLPIHHNETFKHMAEHLNKVASYGNINKMDAKNLALMFGPTLVRKKGDDTASLVSDMSDQCRIVESIILHHDWFFSAWDQDSIIPTETRVETVAVNEQTPKDEDDEAESAISTKEIISSIVSAASKKLKGPKEKSLDSLDTVDDQSSTSACSEFKERSSDDSTLISSSYTKSFSSIASSRSASEEFLQAKSSTPTNRYLESRGSAPIASSESDFMDLEFADAVGSLSSKYQHLHYSNSNSNESVEKNDEMEVTHGLPTHAIHNRLKRINNDVNVVSALLQSYERQKERERWRREQEALEREQRQTELELAQEDCLEDFLAVPNMPDLVSSSYLAGGDSFPGQHNTRGTSENVLVLEQGYVLHPSDRRGPMTTRSAPPPQVTLTAVSPTDSQEDSISQTRCQIQEAIRSSGTTLGPSHSGSHLAVLGSRPSSLRHSLTRRHGSLDSLIDLLDRQEKRASWASSDSEDGSDLLTSITTTFDQKLQILLNPKYKLSGAARRVREGPRPDESNRSSMASRVLQQSYTTSALVDPNDSYKDPSLHRSFRSDPKIGIASRFERDSNRASSSSPVTVHFGLGPADSSQKKTALPDFRSFLGRGSVAGKDIASSVVLTQPKKLETAAAKVVTRQAKNPRHISKSEKTERNSNLARRSREESSLVALAEAEKVVSSDKGKNLKRSGEGRGIHQRRHTVGGTDDFEHANALSQICRGQHAATDRQALRQSAWEQLQPAVKDAGASVQDWIQKERLRGSTPDLTAQE